MTDLNALKAANAARWTKAKATRDFSSVAKRLASPSAKSRYQVVAARTGVPWFFIAVAHEREASQNWNTQLGQGDPLASVSTHVPKGRGPFRTWEDGAYDALVNCAPFAAKNKDWSIGGMLTMLEQYNGLGYASGPTGYAGKPYTPERRQKFAPQASPYIWSGTNQSHPGKYVADGIFDSTVDDVQMGCAGLLLAMMALDSTITFTGAVLSPPTIPIGTQHSRSLTAQLPPPTPSVTSPAKGSLGAFFIDLFKSLFGRKS